MDACGTNKLVHWPKRCSYCREDAIEANFGERRARVVGEEQASLTKKSPRPGADAVMSAGSHLDIALEQQRLASAYESWATMMYRFGFGTEQLVFGFRSSGHLSRTVHLVADESRASRSIALRTANRLEFSAKLSSTPPAYKTIHQQPLKATRTSEMSETLAALPDAPRIQLNRNDVGRS